MKKLIVFALIIAGFIFNASGEELLERINLPEGNVTQQIINLNEGAGNKAYLIVHNAKNYSAQIFDTELKCIAIIDNVVPNQGWGYSPGDVQGKLYLIRSDEKSDNKFVYFATSKPDDPLPWWGIKDLSGNILFKEAGHSANTAYISRMYTDPYGTESIEYCWVDGRMYKINWQSGNVGLTSLSKPSNEGYPNPVKRGEMFNIDIDNLNLKDKAVLMISAINGSMKSRRAVDIDNRSVSVSTGDMEAGIYIYSLISNNKVLKSGRIVVE